jgi:mannosyltransferase OCH1-like enzyme
MADAAACNPGFHLHQFDAATALAYLQDRGETAAATAFATTDNPAAQASILRLAAVFHMGGIWLDAAHYCLTPFDAWIDRRHDLVVLQEPMLSICDALLVAAPGHPVIRAALDQLAGRTLVDGADWCATGAGLLSRAMVQHGLDAAGQPVPGTVIVQQAAIAAHLATIAP